jgi:outer membrane protein TolC
LLDFGVLDGLVDIADLEARARLARYRQSVIESVQEVETSIATYAAQQRKLRQLESAIAASQEAVSLATQRYDRGLSDFLNVLDAQRQDYSLQRQYAAAQQAAADEFVLLYRALGGGWEDYQAVPATRAPQPAIIAAFRRLVASPDATESSGPARPR